MVSVRRWIPLGAAIVIIVAIIVVTRITIAPAPSGSGAPSSDSSTNGSNQGLGDPQAPEFAGITRWLIVAFHDQFTRGYVPNRKADVKPGTQLSEETLTVIANRSPFVFSQVVRSDRHW